MAFFIRWGGLALAAICRSRRHRWRAWSSFWLIAFVVLAVTTPIIQAATDANLAAQPSDWSFFGLHPDLVKAAFYGMFLLVSGGLARSFHLNIKNQNLLFSNQRELERALTQLITLHQLNHADQRIALPDIRGPEVSEK